MSTPQDRRRFLALSSGTLLLSATPLFAAGKLRTVDAGTIKDLTEDGISADPQGRIKVTPDLKFDQKNWSKPASFIAIK